MLLALDYTLHPNKAWHDLVAAPLTEARERHRAKKAARRRSLEQALQAYQRTKSRFYETLDLVQESTRVRLCFRLSYVFVGVWIEALESWSESNRRPTDAN